MQPYESVLNEIIGMVIQNAEKYIDNWPLSLQVVRINGTLEPAVKIHPNAENTIEVVLDSECLIKTAWFKGQHSWRRALALNDVYVTFEDPMTQHPLPKVQFDELYGPACRDLFDGFDLTVDMFFERNPVVFGQYLFTDEAARLDLYDTAVEMNLIPKFKEVCEGETKQEKMNRMADIDDDIIFEAVDEVEDLQNQQTRNADRLQSVTLSLQDNTLSNKARKRLVREQRGLQSAANSVINLKHQ